jgi:FAD/FMN-containing dehydrogenase
MHDNLVQDGILAQDLTQIKNLWAVRESIPEACSKAGAVYKYDISMPVPVLYEMVEDTQKHLHEARVLGEDNYVADVIGYGHMGDGM